MTSVEKGRSEFEGCLSVREGQLNINMQSRSLDDAGVERWCAWADECLPDFVKNKRLPRRDDGFLLCREANFSTNAIGDVGGRSLLRVLFTHKIAVRVVKLFKNNLGRAFASSMMDWLTHTPLPVIELHLSHNFIPREGAVDILKAVGHNKVYPAKNSNGSQQPLWLRLEQNIVEKANELLQVAEEQLMKIRGGKRGAILSMDNVPKSVPADAPCPLAQVAYLINQRDRVRIPPEAQQWRPQAGPREANRWRISLSPEQAELAAKAPTISLARAKTGPADLRDRSDSVTEGEREEVKEAPVWNGLPVAEQLAAKKGPAAQLPGKSEDRPSSNSDRSGPAPYVQESDSDNSDEAPGPVLSRRQSAPANSGLPCKAPPLNGRVEGAPLKAPPMIKAPPGGKALAPPPSAPPPPKPPPVTKPVEVVVASNAWEDARERPGFEVEAPADPFGLTASSLPFGPLGGSLPAVGLPPGLTDPKDSCACAENFSDLKDELTRHAIGTQNGVANGEVRRRSVDESDEEVQNFGPMVQDPMHRANGVHGQNGLVEVGPILEVSSGDPFNRAKEINFRTDLYSIKEAYMRLGRDEFMRRIASTSLFS